MLRGYIFSGNIEKKRETLLAMGVEDSDLNIRIDMDKADREQRAQAVNDLRPGDTLVVANILDFGPDPIEAMTWIAKVAARGAKILLPGDDEPIEYSSTEDAVLTARIAELIDQTKRKRFGKQMTKARAESDATPGRRNRLDNELKYLINDIRSIWESRYSRMERTDKINALLNKNGHKDIGVRTLERYFNE